MGGEEGGSPVSNQVLQARKGLFTHRLTLRGQSRARQVPVAFKTKCQKGCRVTGQRSSEGSGHLIRHKTGLRLWGSCHTLGHIFLCKKPKHPAYVGLPQHASERQQTAQRQERDG